MLGSASALCLFHTLSHLEYTTCQTLCWSIQQTQLWRRGGPCPQGGRCLGRRKNAYHKLSAMGEEDAFANGPKMERWLELTSEGSVHTLPMRRRGIKFDNFTALKSLTFHQK